MRPDERPKKLTRRSASPKGKVFKMMASVSLAGTPCRRADCASLSAYKLKAERKRESNFLPHAPLLRNFPGRFFKSFFGEPSGVCGRIGGGLSPQGCALLRFRAGQSALASPRSFTT